jgi:hypothetical protein
MSYVPGAEDIERKYDYWIEFGIKTERERIMALIEAEKSRSNIGFIQYKVLFEVIEGESK